MVLLFEEGGGGIDENPSVVDDDGPRTNGLHFLEDVGGDYDALFGGHFVDEVADVVLLVGVEAVSGFIEDEDGGVVDEGLGKADAAFVALGERVDGLVIDGLDGAHFYDAVDGVAAFGAFDFADVADEVEEGIDGHFAVSGGVLGKVADGLADLYGLFDYVVAADCGGAAIGGQKAGQHLHCGALAGAVRA